MAAGNIGSHVEELLKGFGVTTVDTGDRVRQLVEEELEKRSLQARVVELRYGRLVLAASPVVARLLAFDRDQLLQSLESAVPGVVRQINIRTER